MQMQKNLSFIYSFLSHVFLQLKQILFQSKKLIIFSKKTLTAPKFNPAPQLPDDELSAYIDIYVEQSIAYQEQEFERWKKANIEEPLHSASRAKQRYWMVFWSALASFFIMMVMVWLGLIPITTKIYHLLTFDFLPTWWPELTLPSSEPPKSPVFFSFITLIISAPIAYAIWMIRDQNTAQQIENSRKDTNLKDFQRLSEWASGFHLPEDKIINSQKTVQKGDETTTETTTTTERFSPPSSDFMLSRRTGAESLQVAAIYQIQKFMYGNYGEVFMEPAFHLLLSMWENIVRPIINNGENPNQIKDQIQKIHESPIGKAINCSLIGDHGMALLLFKHKINGLFLAGISTDHNSLPELKLANIDLRGCDLSYAKLKKAVFLEVNQSQANINYSELTFSSIFRSCLDESSLQHSDISGSYCIHSGFRESKLSSSTLENSDFRLCGFEDAEVLKSNLSDTKLAYSNISGADFSNSNLQNIEFNCKGLKINESTRFGTTPDDYDNPTEQISEEDLKKILIQKGATYYSVFSNFTHNQTIPNLSKTQKIARTTINFLEKTSNYLKDKYQL